MTPRRSKKRYLFRYTHISALLSILDRREISLGDAARWEDTNDTHFLERYRGQGFLRALCFTQVKETSHHWKMYAAGPLGVRIEFSKERLLSAIKNHAESRSFRYRQVKYLKANEAASLKMNDLPFIKRHPFRDEREFRIVFRSNDHRDNIAVQIGLESVTAVTLSPELPDELVEAVKNTIKAISGCDQLNIGKSRLLNYKTWKNKVLKLK